MEKINVAELLKDCPKGMELDCSMFDDVKFISVEEDNKPICIRTGDIYRYLTKFGTWTFDENAKCVIYPKGKTTWMGFVPPCKFNDGDIIFIHTNALKCNLDNSWVSIFKEYRNNRCACYACLCLSDLDFYHDKWEDELLCELCEIEESRLATEEEKQKLFDAIKDNGYKWNAETKTLEKLSKSYKEETMENKPDLLQQLKDYFDNTPREVIEKEWHEYDKYNEIGPTVNEYLEYVNKIRQQQYPKTYKECFNICFGNHHPVVQVVGLDGLGGNKALFERFIKLKICRDAYWQIAGDWRPNLESKQHKFAISNVGNKISFEVYGEYNSILCFPTEEMRDAFFENFKELIEECQEFL